MYKTILVLALGSTSMLAQGNLSFSSSFERRLNIDAGLQAREYQHAALKQRAELTQALTSTEFETVLEDFGRDEVEIAARQSIEAPSIRKNRRLLVKSHLNELESETISYQNQIHNQLSLYFLKAVNTNQLLVLTNNRLHVLEQIVIWQTAKFNEGDLAESALIRTRISVAELKAEVKRIESSAASVALVLSVYLDSTISVSDLPQDVPDYPVFDLITSCWNDLGSAPVIRQSKAGIGSLKASKAMDDAPIISAMSITAGMKILPEVSQRFPIIGFSIESPLFSKRKKTLQLREYELRAGLSEMELIQSELRGVRAEWLTEWKASIDQLSTLEKALIPQATRLNERVDQEYRSGARSFLEVLDTQSLLTDLQTKAVELKYDMAARLFEMNLILGVNVYEFD